MWIGVREEHSLFFLSQWQTILTGARMYMGLDGPPMLGGGLRVQGWNLELIY